MDGSDKTIIVNTKCNAYGKSGEVHRFGLLLWFVNSHLLKVYWTDF